MPQQRGTLYLVVGPSGAGKDSLIDGAKAELVGNGQYVFPRRYITRPADAGGEDHIPVATEMFETMLQRGDMVLEWHAHKLRYGVPAAVQDHLEQGRNVVVNVSRTVVEEARQQLQPMKVLYINVSEDILAERLKARGRESASDIKRRVERAQAYQLDGEDVIMIDNGGALESSISTFLTAINVKA
ncbi:phosphonate metabolism protein/1,5-bisphosphokinase (PRPP-forming) PhnN [Magnetovibrio sp. PR-2]|uniref:phosphonate metabolism protein/1,5-bisphosphokinase (PRPP-forming) PhnN n=1 Tax=Magnetovibrio sp. PR-2 TaxID=3120356 RepID=UPI002FCE38A7